MSKVAIISAKNSGKSTIFKILTGNDNLEGTVKVSDNRLTRLSEIFKPKKTTYATFNIIDIPSKENSNFNLNAQELQSAELLLLVLRLFEDPTIYYPFGPEIDPVNEYDNLISELRFKDLELLDKRAERIKSSLKSAKKTEREEKEKELTLIENIKQGLENGVDISNQNLSDKEISELSSYNLITLKKRIIILNINDNTSQDKLSSIKEHLSDKESLLTFDGKLELELAELDDNDKDEWKKEMGIEYFSSELIVLESFKHLKYITFFTMGEDECRAWPIIKGTNAKRAAGKIHSDLERGFIRAEVIHFDDFVKSGSVNEAKKSGLYRLEGADYIVKDGDILNIRFNV